MNANSHNCKADGDRALPIPQCLQELVNFLEQLTERVPIQKLDDLLQRVAVCGSDLSDFINFGETCYRRNTISENRWYELLCICWRSGQRSPIHNHANSTCGLRVVHGCATETRFVLSPCGQVKAVGSVDFHEGFVCTSQDEQIHQVSNLQANGNDLITLHIYSPPLQCMDTYSIFNADKGSFAPMQID
ncbi:MAG TPA: cysteine dioxygenase family protein [Pirellulaceae bacterium]|nr:cysteine dioxygenase family protein [Pirellulaceae bacterium]HMO93250.1 cysteine dioxygenase family protein [Pirellulaceae bacterium]HMP69115.1 cysteine dioxygenase family protein [Pirellulaceae bacterium]